MSCDLCVSLFVFWFVWEDSRIVMGILFNFQFMNYGMYGIGIGMDAVSLTFDIIPCRM